MKKQEETFFNFVMERTQEQHKSEMSTLLNELINRKELKQLNKAYLMGVLPRALSYLDPSKVDEIKKIVQDFTS